jgi:diguanylate cyclase (GGDEF)-like protein/PAS domain S-box-containing protein
MLHGYTTLEQRLAKQSRALDDLSRALSCGMDLESLARRMTNATVRVTGSDGVSVWLISPEFKQAVCLAGHTSMQGRCLSGRFVPSEALLGVFEQHGQERFVDIFRDDASLAQEEFLDLFPGDVETGSALAGKVCIDGLPRCILVLARRDDERWGIDDRFFAGALLSLLSTALASVESRRVKTELQHKENSYRAIFENTGSATVIIGADGKISMANTEFVRFSGYGAHEMEGRMECWEFFHPEEKEKVLEYHNARRVKGNIAPRKYEARFLRKGGELREVLVSVDLIPGTMKSVASVSDLTPQKRIMAQLSHKSLHDQLTGLPNRLLFIDRLERALLRSRRDQRFQFSVLYLDLDRFKLVNESFGHGEGDKMLVEVARRIGACLGNFDTLARFGGDEFAVLLEGMSGIMDVIRMAECIHDEVARPLVVKGQPVFPGLSIGIVFSGNAQNYTRAEEILRDTDIAMSRTKVSGSVKFKVFDSSMHEQAVSQLRLESDLRSGLERGELETFFQPLFRLSDLSLTGFEALLRWRHPRKGLVSPEVFIPVAEETGMIFSIGSFVLRQALEHLIGWRERFPDRDLTMGVNISGMQITHPRFLRDVEKALDACDCPPALVSLEITESTLMRNERQSMAVLGSLKKMGLTICIDDFGTGYSSLSSLHMLPIDVLKVDKIFTSGNGHGMGNEKIIRTIIRLAKDLGLRVVIEGVETTAQLDRLIELDGDTAQGFLFSAPVVAQEAARIIEQGRWIAPEPPMVVDPSSG